MERQLLLNSYTPVGDIMVTSICYVMIVLVVFSYVSRTKSFKLFLSIVGGLILASMADVSFYTFATHAAANPLFVTYAYVMRCIFHALLFGLFVLFIKYISEATHLSRKERMPYEVAAFALFLTVVIADIISTVNGGAFIFTDQSIVYHGRDIFLYGYIAFTVLIIAMLMKVRKRLYKRVMMGFYATVGISFGILFIQGLDGQMSYTVASFLYPVLGMFYILHSNPYDAEIGANDTKAFEDTIHYNYEAKKGFYFISLYMRRINDEGVEISNEMQATIRQFAAEYFKGEMLFRLGRGHLILLISEKKNPNAWQRIQGILEAFYKEYNQYQEDFKVVIGHSIDEISEKNEYISFLRSVHRNMDENSVHWIEDKDVAMFRQTEYIRRELGDISRKHDLDDPRVLAYCQPVFNLKTGRYDTGEALMRLELPDIGIVSPLQFIPLAEETGTIHALTQIILHKTCESIRKLMDDGYDVTRISVNVSVPELKDEQFCEDIIGIIGKSRIPGSKIAIELTESQNDDDFRLMKEKIEVLRHEGIKFYLDDFGTGYSNMERIMALPFDIIKFDRSLVLGAESAERSRKIVKNLATMFTDMNYSVLYEGVEEDSEEQMCRDMAASYLQGYKYSRPIPIEQMDRYFAAC